MTDMSHVYAIFVDLMGFTHALERASADDMSALIQALQNDGGAPSPSLPLANHIYKQYTGFHETLSSATPLDEQFEVIAFMSFSDCAFIVTSSSRTVADVCFSVMTQSFRRRTPVRLGMALGSFMRLAFESKTYPAGGLERFPLRRSHSVAAMPGVVRAFVWSEEAERGRDQPANLLKVPRTRGA